MSSISVRLVGGLCLIAAAAWAPVVIAQHVREGPSVQAKSYSDRARDVTVGRSVYLRSTRTPVGRILAADDDHPLPKGFPHPRARAVLIRRFDGPMGWQPVEGIGRIYVVR